MLSHNIDGSIDMYYPKFNVLNCFKESVIRGEVCPFEHDVEVKDIFSKNPNLSQSKSVVQTTKTFSSILSLYQLDINITKTFKYVM